MKIININLLGDRPPSLLPSNLNIDPELLLRGIVGAIIALILPLIIGFSVDKLMLGPAVAENDRILRDLGTNKNTASVLRKEKERAEALEKDYESLLKLARQSATWKSVLEEVRDLTPTDAWLTRLSIDGGNKLKIEGKALDYRAIAFFYTNFQNANHFARPVLGSLQSESVGGQAVIRFNLDCDINDQGLGG
ncbi:PilN domain-containing protein [bacterium]|nr:PilN domain-containing protein [bacterium]